MTVAGRYQGLDVPFFVMATQNPLEMEGTYPLPEAQLDRFFFKLKVEYPSLDELDLVMERTTKRDMPTVDKVCDGEQINRLEQSVRDILIAEDVRRYALRLVLGTHPESEEAPGNHEEICPLRVKSTGGTGVDTRWEGPGNS